MSLSQRLVVAGLLVIAFLAGYQVCRLDKVQLVHHSHLEEHENKELSLEDAGAIATAMKRTAPPLTAASSTEAAAVAAAAAAKAATVAAAGAGAEAAAAAAAAAKAATEAAAAAEAPTSRAGARDLTIVVVSDAVFFNRFSPHLQTIQCYANRHGYKFKKLDPALEAPVCQTNQKNFFFRKHCAVRYFLAKQPPKSYVVVLDGDVLGGVSDKSLDQWLDAADFDIAFYERSWNFAIAAGNYIVRNTKFARRFLQLWALYENVIPPGRRFACCPCMCSVCHKQR